MTTWTLYENSPTARHRFVILKNDGSAVASIHGETDTADGYLKTKALAEQMVAAMNAGVE